MAEVIQQIAFHWCKSCEIESGPEDPFCWLCGKPMEAAPERITVRNEVTGRFEERLTDGWRISAMLCKGSDFAVP